MSYLTNYQNSCHDLCVYIIFTVHKSCVRYFFIKSIEILLLFCWYVFIILIEFTQKIKAWWQNWHSRFACFGRKSSAAWATGCPVQGEKIVIYLLPYLRVQSFCWKRNYFVWLDVQQLDSQSFNVSVKIWTKLLWSSIFKATYFQIYVYNVCTVFLIFHVSLLSFISEYWIHLVNLVKERSNKNLIQFFRLQKLFAIRIVAKLHYVVCFKRFEFVDINWALSSRSSNILYV